MKIEYEIQPEFSDASVWTNTGRPEKVFWCGSCCAQVFISTETVNGRKVKRSVVSFGKQCSGDGLPRGTATLHQDDLPGAIVALGEANDWLRRVAFGLEEDPGAV